jgi:1-acyl-sn-glycerol-3-phosphate acyltransferase
MVLCCTLGTLYAVVRWGYLNTDRDFARIFSWGVLKILRIRVVVEGREHLKTTQPCIYVANHQSNLDMATFGGIYPQKTVVIGKKELHFIPFFGIYFVASGNIIIDRKKSAKAVAGLSHAAEEIKKRGVSIWIFPEGTRNVSGEGMLPFKKGAFHMAIQAGVPIVPMVSSPLKSLVSWKGRYIRPGVMRVRVLPPIDSKKYDESQIELFSQEVREKMLDAIREISR